MNNSTSKPHFKQVFKKQPVLECRLRFANGNTVRQRFSRDSLRNSKWLEKRIRKLANTGASGETILTAYTSGLRVVTRQGKARRQMARSIAPVRRQTVAAPVVARAHVRESAESHNDGGGGGSDDSEDSDGSDGPDSPFLSPFGGNPRNTSRKHRITDLTNRLTLGCAGLLAAVVMSLILTGCSL